MTRSLLTKAEVSQRYGWSKRTINRKIAQGCFPCYRFSGTDVKYRVEDIEYYVESCRQGDFSQRRAA